MTNEVAERTPTKGGLRTWLNNDVVIDGIRDALAGTIPEREFISQMVIAFQQPGRMTKRGYQPGPADCTDKSKFEAVHVCATLGLLPTLNQVAIVPRAIKDQGTCATVVPQWQGLKSIMERHPDVKEVTAHLVHELDGFKFLCSENTLVHEYSPFDPKRTWSAQLAELKGGYLRIDYVDGRHKYHFVRQDEILKRKKCAETSMVWDAWPKEQALKTIYRDAFARRVVPLDPLAQRSMSSAVEREDEFLKNDPSRVIESRPNGGTGLTIDILADEMRKQLEGNAIKNLESSPAPDPATQPQTPEPGYSAGPQSIDKAPKASATDTVVVDGVFLKDAKQILTKAKDIEQLQEAFAALQSDAEARGQATVNALNEVYDTVLNTLTKE